MRRNTTGVRCRLVVSVSFRRCKPLTAQRIVADAFHVATDSCMHRSAGSPYGLKYLGGMVPQHQTGLALVNWSGGVRRWTRLPLSHLPVRTHLTTQIHLRQHKLSSPQNSHPLLKLVRPFQELGSSSSSSLSRSPQALQRRFTRLFFSVSTSSKLPGMNLSSLCHRR